MAKDDIQLAGTEEKPKENPYDEEYETKVRASDALKYLPDQQEVPETKLRLDGPEHEPEIVQKLLAEEREKELRKAEREVKKEDREQEKQES